MTRQDKTGLAAVFLLPAVVVGYAVVIVLGFMWPERPMVAIVASIVVSLAVLVGSAAWLLRRVRRWLSLCLILLLLVVLVFPMIGTASLGTNLALETRADEVSAKVVGIEVEQVTHREGQETFRTTYTLAAIDDSRALGTLEYRGDRLAHGLAVGDRAEVLADPSGELPVKLVGDVDSGRDIGMIAVGGVLYLAVFVIGLARPAARARF